MKLLLAFILCLNLMFAKEDNSNVVKTSELELFLFKVGFESLLKDVDSTKSKVNLNEDEIKKLNSKVEIIMNEIYKDKRVLNPENSKINVTNLSNNQELEELKKEIQALKIQINELKSNKLDNEAVVINNTEEKIISKKKNIIKGEEYIVSTKAYLRDAPMPNSKVLAILEKGEIVTLDYCDKFSWCKLIDSDIYVPVYSLKKR
jgi:hypothetical protein